MECLLNEEKNERSLLYIYNSGLTNSSSLHPWLNIHDKNKLELCGAARFGTGLGIKHESVVCILVIFLFYFWEKKERKIKRGLVN